MHQNFIGKWSLIPERSEYERGDPPVAATYAFEYGSGASLDVSISWINKQGKVFELHFNLTPDGRRRDYPQSQIAEEVMAEFDGPNVLNSWSYKDGKTLAFATRIIESDGLMKVVQRIYPPYGGFYENVQYYSREPASGKQKE